MDRETIYLDIDEEITSVVDKLKNSEVPSLDIVIPKDALLLKSVVNLKLLKRQADSLGKEIAIVTQDKVGKKLAEQIGLAVIEKPGQEVKEVRMSENEPEEKIEYKKSKSASKIKEEEEPIQFKPEEEGVVAETSEVVKTDSEKENEYEPEEEIEVPKEKIAAGKGKGGKWKKYGLLGGFGALALAVAAYIYVPLATVNLKLAAEKKKVDFSFTVDKSNTAVDTSNASIPGRLISEEKETSNKYQATGKKTVGEKASGRAIIYNDSSINPLPINAGERLITSDNIVFRLIKNTTINTGSSADVEIVADQIGSKYNIGSGVSLSLPGIGSDKIYAKTNTSLSGGSSRDITFVTQSDVNKAKDDMSKNAKGDLQRAIQEKVQADERLLDDAIKINIKSATPSVAVGDEATEFELRVKANVQAMVFKDDDLKKLAESVLADQIGSTKEIVESDALISEATFVDADFEKGTMQARLSGEAFVAAKIDQNKVKTELSGDSEQAAKDYLLGLDGVDEVEIRFFPSFYKRIPRITGHIYIKTSLNKVQE